MIPVRSVEKSNSREVRVIELGDEHRGHAVERGAPLLLHRGHGRQRLEGLARDHHAGAVGGAGEVAEHHPEAVVEGHRDADAVLLGVVERLADEEAVVEDVVVGERRPLGEAGRARGVLNVDGVVELQRRLEVVQGRVLDLLAGQQQVGPALVEDQRLPEQRKPAPHLLHHARVVAGSEGAREHQQADLRLAQRVLQLRRLVGRVDVDQDGADARRRVLQDDPFRAVGRPDADPVAALDAVREEPLGAARRLVPELAIREAEALLPVDQRLAVTEPLHAPVEVLSDRLAEQRGSTSALDVRRFRHRVTPPTTRNTAGHRMPLAVEFVNPGVRLLVAPCPAPPPLVRSRRE